MLGKTIDRRTFLQALGHRARRGRGRLATAVQHDRQGGSRARRPAGKTEVKRTVCTHCSVGCADRRRGAERRLDPPGAGVRFADQPRRALRQGRLDPRARHDARLAPPEVPDEARGRQVAEDHLGPGAEGSQRQAARDPQGERARTRLFWIGSSKHNNEQAYLFRKFVSMFGTNNMDHQARICHSTTVAGVANTWGYGAMTNSYNDEQNSKCILFFGSERGRGAPGVDAAYAARQGKRRQGDRRRSALHAHRGQGRHLLPHPLRHRRRVPVRHAAPHLQERLGRQGVHQRPRLRHGQGARRSRRSGRRTRSKKSPA